MPESPVVHETVKRMLSSGIDDETIKLTLMDIGLTEAEARAAIAGAKGIAPKPAARPEPPPETVSEAGEADEEEEQTSPDEETEASSEEDEMAGAIGEDTIEEEPSAPVKAGPKPVSRAVRPAEEQQLRETTSQVLAEEHHAAIGDVGRRVEELHEKLPAAMMPNENLQKSLIAQARDISDLKASSSALQSLLKKILETDRKILLELSKKK